MHVVLEIDDEHLKQLTALDRFQGRWAGHRGVSRPRLERMARASRVLSTAASCRMAGLRISDAETAALLDGDAVPLSDAPEVLGYASALDWKPPRQRLLEPRDLVDLYRRILGLGPEDVAGDEMPWRRTTLDREAFDSEGRSIGLIFPTLPPRFIEERTTELLTWLEFELRAAERHPALVVAAAHVYWLAISPFPRGNGRMARVLAAKLLERAGYGFLPYASLESEMEKARDAYYHTFDRAQTHLWTGAATLGPWLSFFLELLGRHRERVERKVEIERSVEAYSPLQRSILETVREHGSVDAGLLIRATGANRNTLKDNLRRLVDRGVLRKTGQRRGTRYRMETGEAPVADA